MKGCVQIDRIAGRILDEDLHPHCVVGNSAIHEPVAEDSQRPGKVPHGHAVEPPEQDQPHPRAAIAPASIAVTPDAMSAPAMPASTSPESAVVIHGGPSF